MKPDLKRSALFLILINNIVAIDTSCDRLVAIGTLFIEKKFYRGCAKLGHVEDIVVNKDYGKKGIGQDVVALLAKIGKANQCYKLTLYCKNELESFYSKNDFYTTGLHMVVRFD